MKSVSTVLILVTVFCGTRLFASESTPIVSNMGNVQGGDVKAAHGIIEKKCTTCHSGTLIDAAITANKDMSKIQQEMEKKGARLNANEREVLGIYWKSQNPLKKGK
jgi:uncharacterized membrane protein